MINDTGHKHFVFLPIFILVLCINLVSCSHNSSQETANAIETVNMETQTSTVTLKFEPKEIKDYDEFEGIPDFGAYTGLEKTIDDDGKIYSYSLADLDSALREEAIESYVQELKSRGFCDYEPNIEPLSNEIWLRNDKYYFYAMAFTHFNISITPRSQFSASVEPYTQENLEIPKDELIVNSNGKKIWKVYINNGYLYVKAKFNGSGHFSIKLLNNNQDFVELICNEIGDYIVDKKVDDLSAGYYYIEISCTDGSWECSWSGTGGH